VRLALHVRASEVIASDETSAHVKGKTHWQWAFGCAIAVYHAIAPPSVIFRSYAARKIMRSWRRARHV
jgi:hypothetical protein